MNGHPDFAVAIWENNAGMTLTDSLGFSVGYQWIADGRLSLPSQAPAEPLGPFSTWWTRRENGDLLFVESPDERFRAVMESKKGKSSVSASVIRISDGTPLLELEGVLPDPLLIRFFPDGTKLVAYHPRWPVPTPYRRGALVVWPVPNP